jgi:spermidine/putrescine-binding protein
LETIVPSTGGRGPAARLVTRRGPATWPPPPARIEEEPGDLRVLDWPGYEDPELFAGYRARGGSPMIEESRDTEEAIRRLRRDRSIDLAHPEVGYVEPLVDLGLVRPFDPGLLENLGRVPPPLLERGRVEQALFHVPTDFGFVAPLVRTDRLEDATASYELLFDRRYRGRIAWFDTPWMLVIAGYVLGAEEPWDMTDRELAEATSFLADRIGLIAGFWSRHADLNEQMAADEVWVAYAWNVSFLDLRRAGVPVRFVTDPREGPIVWTEGFVLAADTRNYHHAHRFVDAWLAPATALALTGSTGMGHVSLEVDRERLAPEEIAVLRLDDAGVFADPAVHLDRAIPRRALYLEAWEAVRERRRLRDP